MSDGRGLQSPPPVGFRVVAAGTPRPVWTSTFFAAAIMGDSALYVLLPAFAPRLGLSLFAIGILLSVNRWIRLPANPLAARASERWGLNRLYLAAMGAATVTTACWAVPLPLPAWLAARVGWGLAFAILRLARLATVAERPSPRVAGLSQAVFRAGSAAAVLSAGLLAARWGFYGPFRLYALVATMATAAAIWGEVRRRPWGPPSVWAVPGPTVPLARGQVAVGLGAFTGQFVVDGVLVATLGYFVATRWGSPVQVDPVVLEAAALTGMVLSGRWIAEIVLARPMGAMADRLGHGIDVPLALLLTASGLLDITRADGAGAFLGGAALTWLGRTALGVGLDAAATQTAGTRPAADVARYATLGDLGAALGPLLAGLGGPAHLEALYVLGAALLVGSAAVYAGPRRREG
ncbi:MAG: MFS transporter [Actinomycetia bacterium]|nr:MFS transporter [Actinomycetes bacterium]